MIFFLKIMGFLLMGKRKFNWRLWHLVHICCGKTLHELLFVKHLCIQGRCECLGYILRPWLVCPDVLHSVSPTGGAVGTPQEIQTRESKSISFQKSLSWISTFNSSAVRLCKPVFYSNFDAWLIPGTLTLEEGEFSIKQW